MASALVHYITLPFHHYAQWVRENPENAQSLERMTRTMSIFLTDPSHLLKMEGCYAICKLHSFINQSIMSSSGNAAYQQLLLEQQAAEEGEEEGGEVANEDALERKKAALSRRLGLMPVAEAAALLSGMLTELECLLELLVRDYTKCQVRTWRAMLLLEGVKVACNSLSSYAQYLFVPFLWRSVWMQLTTSVRRCLSHPSRLFLGSRAAAPHDAVAAVAASTGNSLTGAAVGPHRTRLLIPRVVDSTMDGGDPHARWVPVTGTDLLGIVSDLALLLRPLLLVSAAYAAFPAGDAGRTIALLPAPVAAGGGGAEQAEAERENRLLKDALTSDKSRLLLSSWRVWLLFAAFDFILLIVARFIRRRRAPVVHITDRTSVAEAAAAPKAEEREEEAEGSAAESDPAALLRSAMASPATGALQEAGAVPPLVARDALRIQQAVRNLSFSFMLRDPFFTAVIKPFFNRHLLNGFLSRIPLLGGLVHHQASYVLYMQHFSFLYSVGQ
ncbi:hypothetical protein STCU_11397 [Strigomonas culicis]|uniref:Peroxisomal membrane protein PEX16 n=1 Tax=Strigomonas culicis TaxID=28005 RepID=S9THC4_9TRYP|nr:hypothetical protein STCU_11397 [Strigomonas culicis]|eukprot:EPY16324.1 hypothetical protein STCU_11397 [Strigomonas culicis]